MIPVDLDIGELTMAKARASRATSYFPVKIPVYSLSGGVGKQIPTKRLPTECSVLTNFFCTTQSSLDKRNGFRWADLQGDFGNFSDDTVENLFFHWMEVDAITSYLFIINTNVTYSIWEDHPDKQQIYGGPREFLTVYKITTNLQENDLSDANYITTEKLPTLLGSGKTYIHWNSWKYLVYQDPDPAKYLPAQKRLEAVTIGSSVLILNKQVKAGFTTINGKIELDFTSEETQWIATERLKALDGTELPEGEPVTADWNTSADLYGGNIQYLTAASVDPQNKAEVWNEYKDYTWGSTVIDPGDPVFKPGADDDSLGNDSYPFKQFRGRTWDDSPDVVNGGGVLVIDFNSEVLRLDSTTAYHKDSKLGNQITLRGSTNDGEAQVMNYVWMHREKEGDSFEIRRTGQKHFFTSDGTPDGTADGPERPETFVVNPVDHLNNTQATAKLTLPRNYAYHRYPRQTFTYDRNDDGEIGHYEVDYSPGPIAALNGSFGLMSSHLESGVNDRSKTEGDGYFGITQWKSNYDGYENPTDDPDKLQYFELTDSAGLTTRFYTGFSKGTSTGSIGWEPGTAYRRSGNAAVTEAYIREQVGYGGRLVDIWTSDSPAKSFAGAINDSDLAITATYSGHRTVYLTQDAGGDAGNTEINLMSYDLVNNNYYKIAVNDLYEPPEDGFRFTGGIGTSYDDGYTAEELGSGFADAAELAKVINLKQSETLIAYSNQFSVTDDTTYPGRLIVLQKDSGRHTNTSIWYNSFTENDDDAGSEGDIIYDLSTHVAQDTIPLAFSGGTDGDTINNIINPTWDGGEGSTDYWEAADEWTQQQQFLTNDGDPLRFGIWKVRSYLEADELPGPTNVLLSADENPKGSKLPPHQDTARWERVLDEASSLETPEGNKLNVATSAFMPVEDYVYPDGDAPELGQSITKLSDLKFPPDITDLEAFNGDNSTVVTLRWLYDEDQDTLDPFIQGDLTHYQAQQEINKKGKGKIIHLSEAYLENTPGWYRYINMETAPYLQKIRTPGKRAVIDKRRMPQMLYPSFKEDQDTGTLETVFGIRPVEWDPRTSGNDETNRGPGIFFNPSTGEPQETNIKTLAFYRDRLFLANDDTIIASASGDWDNFFLADPDNISDTDPLDLMVSSNNYTPITSLIPFRDFLFVGTSGNTQYELVGSNNIISPKTAEFAPTAFYPMLPDVRPISMNNNLFFFSDRKLYIYFGQRDLATEQAFEVSKHVEGYLPNDLTMATSSSHGSMIFGLDTGSEINGVRTSTIFCYRNQVAGEKVVQNAFFDWKIKLSKDPQFGGSATAEAPFVQFIQGSGSSLFAVVGAVTERQANSSNMHLELWYMPLKKDHLNIPRLDKLVYLQSGDVEIGSGGNAGYDPVTNRTNIGISLSFDPNFAPVFDTIVTRNGEVVPLTYDNSSAGYRYWVDGDRTGVTDGATRWIDTVNFAGIKYKSLVTLSETFVRDEGNNIVPGTLNLRYGLIQTFNSPHFDIKVSSPTRDSKTTTFNKTDATANYSSFGVEVDVARPDFIGNPYGGAAIGTVQEGSLGDITIEKDIASQVRFPILGFSQDIEITISSDNPHPLNIASLQFNGKFKPITKFHSS